MLVNIDLQLNIEIVGNIISTDNKCYLEIWNLENKTK